MDRRYRALPICLCLAACTGASSDFGRDANEIAETGDVPRAVKVIAAEMLHRCNVPAHGRSIFYQWEASEGEAAYTLELSRQQMSNPATTRCLERQAKALGVAGEIDWGEEPPPPPAGDPKAVNIPRSS